ncbi:MAG: hypothetical protein ABSC93_22100 [Bryobacteraceae bacterium]|jgi:hypothetical protein
MAGNNAHPGDEPRNPHVHHEPGDVNAIALTKFGLSMSALIVIFLFGLWGMFNYLKNQVAEMGRPLSASAIVNAQKQPPEPRLQQHAAGDMRTWRAAEERALHQYGWIDPDKGIVQIPVERAMDLIVQRGLPAPAQASGKTK